jgi:RHS repeat-associated protein
LIGNRLSETRSAGTTGYVYDAADELTGSSGPGGSVVYGYDGRGEQTSAGAVGYGYDLAGRLTSATVAGTTTVYGYDGDGNRLSATAGASTVEYLWDINNDLPELALERSGAGAPLRAYVRGLDTVALLEGGARFYYHHDRLGSVTALTSASGASEWLYSYEPFGSPRTTSRPDPSAPVNPLGFTGQYQDPGSGLLNLRARQYDEASGRFLSTDPAPAGPTEPYTDAYDYAGQDPVNQYDLAGTLPGSGLVKKAKKALRKAKEAGLEIAQEAPYAAYYASYQALGVFQNRVGDVASKTLLPAAAARAFLVQTEAVGFAGNAAIDKRRGKSVYDDARKDSILPNVIARHWNPSWLQTYLPGGGTRPNGSHFIDFRH